MKIEYRVQQVLHLVRIVRGQALILISAGCSRLNAAGSYSAQRDQKLRRDGCDGVERAIVVPDICCFYPICASMRGCSVSFSPFELKRVKNQDVEFRWHLGDEEYEKNLIRNVYLEFRLRVCTDAQVSSSST